MVSERLFTKSMPLNLGGLREDLQNASQEGGEVLVPQLSYEELKKP